MANKIDWTRLINEILKSDKSLSLALIAKSIGLAKSSVVRMRLLEIEPKYHIGDALITLWRRSTNQPDTNPPQLKDRCKHGN